MPASCTIKDVLCVLPSTGTFNSDIQKQWQYAVTAAGGAAGAAAGAIAAGALTAGTAGAGAVSLVVLPSAGLAAGGVIAAGLSEIAVNVSNKIGRSFADSLYIEVNGDKKWPTDSYYDLKASDRVDVDVSFDVSGLTTVNLREHDVILKDDYLFSFQVSPYSPSGLYAQPAPTSENGCMYVVDVAIEGH